MVGQQQWREEKGGRAVRTSSAVPEDHLSVIFLHSSAYMNEKCSFICAHSTMRSIARPMSSTESTPTVKVKNESSKKKGQDNRRSGRKRQGKRGREKEVGRKR
jgi:hypothetical protein